MKCIKNSNLKLQNHQLNVVDFFNKDKTRGLLVFHDVGTGKTLTAVTASQCFLEKNPNNNVIIITPTSLQKNFIKELERYGADPNDNRYKYFTIHGINNALTNNVITCDFFKNSLLIIDECHNLRKEDRQSKLAHNIITCAKESKKVLLLTATPLINGPHEIINLISLVDGVDPISINRFLNLSQKERDEYFKCKISFYKTDNKKQKDFFPDAIVKNIFLLMSQSYYKKYKILENFPTNSEKIFYNAIRQASNNIENEKSEKIDWVLDKIKNSLKNEKFIVFSHFLTKGILLLKTRLEKEKIPISFISGDVPKKYREEAIQKYNKNEIKVLLISKSGSEGLDLKNTNSVIIMEPSWNESTHRQVIGRAVRYKSHIDLPKNLRHVNVYYLHLIKPQEQKIASKIINDTNYTIKNDEKLSIDLYMRNFSNKKQKEIDEFLENLKSFSIEKRKCNGNKPFIDKNIENNTDLKKIKKSRAPKSKVSKSKSKVSKSKSRVPKSKSRVPKSKSRAPKSKSRAPKSKSRAPKRAPKSKSRVPKSKSRAPNSK